MAKEQGTNRLTALAVERAGPGTHSDGGNLLLQVDKGGSRGWVFRYQLNGRRRDMRIGPFPAHSLRDARRIAADLRAKVARGIDPLDERRAAEAAALEVAAAAEPAPPAPPFAEIAADFIKAHAPSWKSAKHRWQWENTLPQCAAAIWNKPVDTITRDDVVALLLPIWSTKTETATRTRQRIELILDAAAARGLRTGENPARWKGGLSALLPAPSRVAKVEHHPALPWREAPALYSKLRENLSVSALALEWLILTATRASETAGARWDEIDETAMVWTIPAARMKAGKPQRVPIVPRMAEILKALPRRGPGVFPGLKARTTLHPESLRRCLQRDLGREDISVHGWRSTFRDWAGDNGQPHELAELALAHAAGDAVVTAYRRGDALDLRRPMMEAWCDFLNSKKKRLK
jgi:integrase